LIQQKFLLWDIIVTALSGVIANCDGWRDIALFALSAG
jgi:hypothetical protein